MTHVDTEDRRGVSADDFGSFKNCAVTAKANNQFNLVNRDINTEDGDGRVSVCGNRFVLCFQRDSGGASGNELPAGNGRSGD
jgi:hypothetical protein